jgi:hypothetical protein
MYFTVYCILFELLNKVLQWYYGNVRDWRADWLRAGVQSNKH